MAEHTSKAARLFEYLLAVKNLNEKICRSTSDYEKAWWEADLPNTEDCLIGGTGLNQEAWLEVHKQEIPSPPPIPENLQKWITNHDDPDKNPVVRKALIKGKDEEDNRITEEFEDNAKRVHTYNQWFKEKWLPWATEAAPKQKIQKLYMEFFTLYQRFQREGEDLEICWGHGLLQWNVANTYVQRHVLVTKLELLFDAKQGIFSLIPTSKGTIMETDMLLNIDIPNATRLMEMEKQVEEFDLSPLHTSHFQPFLQEIVHTISPEGLYIAEHYTAVSHVKTPVISYSPAIFLRNVGGRLWQGELTKAVEKIKAGFPVPDTIASLTTIEELKLRTASTVSSTSWSKVGEELLFPLPTNKEQQLIAQKLAANSGVVVQGPPGTGKSHTIANLICHLLAHGKRVLVTSEKERALKVLRDKIPEEIRALCVSVLGGDSKSVKEIEDSIKMIAEKLDSKQPEILDRNIERLKAQLKTTKRATARIDTLINEAAQRENTSCQIAELELNPLEASKWLQQFKEHSWLPDYVTADDSIPLTDEQFKKFFELLGLLSKKDIASLCLRLPSLEALPIPSLFAEKVSEIQSIEEKVRQTASAIQDWNPQEYINLDYGTWMKQIHSSKEELQSIINQEWLHTILLESSKDSSRKVYWDEFVSETDEMATKLQGLEKDLLEHVLLLPSGKTNAELKEDLSILKQKLSASSGLGWFFKNVTARKYKYLLDEARVNELPIRNAADVELLLKHTEAVQLRQKLILKWNRIMDDIGGITLQEDQKRFVLSVKEQIQAIRKAVSWNDIAHSLFHDLNNKIGKPGSPVYSQVSWFEEVYNGLQALEHKKIWTEANRFFDQIHAYVTKGKDNSVAHSIWEQFFTALQMRDKELWRQSYVEVARLEGLTADYRQFEELKNKLQQIAPKWTTQLLESGGEGKPLFPPADLKQAWLWQQVSHWIKEIQRQPKVEDLEEERRREQRKEQQIIKELVAESTWKEQILRTTSEQKRSLFAWLKAIQRIGKGTGKYTTVYRKEASKEMKTARGAIPVWIMPIQRVIESFDLTHDLFDVIIVDESSQSDLFALSALMRAKKAVIVGDDNQISPESSFTDVGDVHKLIERFLYDIPNANQFDIRTSLYDTANRVYESKIILKEHYRCVPEIIQFSNDLMYGGMIDPLRLPIGSEMLTPPAAAIRVKDGYRLEGISKALNEPEAEAIAEFVKKCIHDSKYKGKSFGVISLQGQDQARIIENFLRDTIGEEEMINRRLIVGDAYSFQGDERDVIFLSMVIASNVRFNALTKRSDLQRFNVAASRARDQMILFHSVDANQLNPNDVRYNLLQYCKDPHRVQTEIQQHEQDFDSQFEKDVYQLIASRGYRVIPQVKVGTLGKKIDLVVEGMRTRLAVECDGDRWHGLDKWEEDMERQRVLERVGWTFWRVRGSAFYANPAKSMESLWDKLNEMGIEPSQGGGPLFEERKGELSNSDQMERQQQPPTTVSQMSLDDF